MNKESKAVKKAKKNLIKKLNTPQMKVKFGIPIDATITDFIEHKDKLELIGTRIEH